MCERAATMTIGGHRSFQQQPTSSKHNKRRKEPPPPPSPQQQEINNKGWPVPLSVPRAVTETDTLVWRQMVQVKATFTAATTFTRSSSQRQSLLQQPPPPPQLPSSRPAIYRTIHIPAATAAAAAGKSVSQMPAPPPPPPPPRPLPQPTTTATPIIKNHNIKSVTKSLGAKRRWAAVAHAKASASQQPPPPLTEKKQKVDDEHEKLEEKCNETKQILDQFISTLCKTGDDLSCKCADLYNHFARHMQSYTRYLKPIPLMSEQIFHAAMRERFKRTHDKYQNLLYSGVEPRMEIVAEAKIETTESDRIALAKDKAATMAILTAAALDEQNDKEIGPPLLTDMTQFKPPAWYDRQQKQQWYREHIEAYGHQRACRDESVAVDEDALKTDAEMFVELYCVEGPYERFSCEALYQHYLEMMPEAKSGFSQHLFRTMMSLRYDTVSDGQTRYYVGVAAWDPTPPSMRIHTRVTFL